MSATEMTREVSRNLSTWWAGWARL